MDPSPCKPFDQKRAGMSLGRRGSHLNFRSLEEAMKRGAKIYAEFLGYGIGGEAYHITAPEPNGMTEARVMKEAIEEGGISPDEVDISMLMELGHL